MLWRKPVDGWLFVTLLANPGKPADVCLHRDLFGEPLRLTAPLLVKYSGRVARDGA